jgi:hypothetical protein
MSGNARGPSTAFCILKRLFVLKPTPRQVRTMLQHEDSPYIRAVRGRAAPTRAFAHATHAGAGTPAGPFSRR